MLSELPSEIWADILSELDLASIINASYTSKLFHTISSDPSLNPFRKPVVRAIHAMKCDINSEEYTNSSVWLKNLSIRSTVPRQNFIELFSLASPWFLLFETTAPNLSSAEWRETFERRFLPGWSKWRGEGSWREAYKKMLYRVYHRSLTNCTADEAWTKYIVLNRNGSVNQLEMSSRNYNPLAIFNEMKLITEQSYAFGNTHPKLADVRILAFGTLNRPRTTLTVNSNAYMLLHPPGIEVDRPRGRGVSSDSRSFESIADHSPVADHGVYPGQALIHSPQTDRFPSYSSDYTKLFHPLPAPSHANYPFHTPGGADERWDCAEDREEEGLKWVGGMMLTVQIIMPNSRPATYGNELVSGPGRSQYASFTWPDLWAIAPWLQERVPMSRRIDGPGLGLE